jgi:prophage antirepressor-like protein
MNLPVIYTNNQIACLIEGSPVSAWLDEQGQPMWFASTELGKAIGLSRTRMVHVLADLSEDDKGVRETHTLGGRQTVTVVSRSGAYQVIAQLQDRDLGRRLRKGLSDLAVAYETGKLTANYDSLQRQVDELRTKLDIAIHTRKILNPARQSHDERVELTRKFIEERMVPSPGYRLRNEEIYPALVGYLREHGADLRSNDRNGRSVEVGLLLSKSGLKRVRSSHYNYTSGLKLVAL